jgi:hypothetical protein
MLHDDSDGSVPPWSRERLARRAALVFLAVLILAPGCATFDAAQIEAERAAERLAIEMAARTASGFVGVYAGRLPAAAGSGRSMTLELRADGRAQLVNVYLGRGLRAERGRWFATGDTLRVEWESVDEAIVVMPTEWVRSGSTLVPTAWDPVTWGNVGFPLSRWEASRAPRAGCAWRPFADAMLGLRLLVESCAEGVAGSRFTTRGAEIVDVSGVGEGERGTPVIQVFSKPAGTPMDAAIRARFFPEMVPRMRAGCRIIRIRFENGDEPDGRETWEILPTEKYQENTAKWRAAEPAAMVCGPYGQRNGRGYFEFHPAKSKTRYLFVWLGAGEPRFDEHSIELLD